MREIKLFGKALNTQDMSPVKVNQLAVSKGYVVHPDCCNGRVYDFLQAMPTNYHNTFYQSVADVVAKDRFELLIDQITHYASTYGTEFAGTPYIVNDTFGSHRFARETSIDFSDCKVISPITYDELAEKLREMVYSGIALKGETLEDIIALIEEFSIMIDVNQVKNIEFKMYLYSKLNVLPSSPEEMVRYLVYLHTGTTLLIKDSMTLRIISSNPKSIESLVDSFGAEKLASVFFRFKPLFLAMKSESNKKIINKLRRLANKHHKPFVPGYWETILQGKVNASEFLRKLPELSNFKKVRLIKAIDERLANVSSKLYIIRNGKTHVETAKDYSLELKATYEIIRGFIYNSLVESLKDKACTIKLPKNIRLAIPSSEKTFVGNIPLGSYLRPDAENFVFGINWFGADGAQDLDLSYVDLNGRKIGWNSRYYDSEYDRKNIIYSGDMTWADPEACEYMFCKDGMENGLIYVNAYHAHENSKFTFFTGQTDEDFVVTKGTVSNDIIDFRAQMTITGESFVGFYIDGNIYFADLNSGSCRVSSFSSKSRDVLQYFIDTKDTFLYWDELLKDAGFTIYADGECAISLADADPSVMISLLS